MTMEEAWWRGQANLDGVVVIRVDVVWMLGTACRQ